MGNRIRALDWSATSLGTPETWPLSLRSSVRMMLASRQPICICWGPELITLYNDSFAPFLGDKESFALGESFQVIWSEIWDDLLPFASQALSGTGTWTENLPLLMNRYGYLEETYWTFSYSPVYGDDDRVAGFINIAADATPAVMLQRDLAKSVSDAHDHIELQDANERQQRILQREMIHRIKNTLAMTSAIVSQTMRHATTMSGAADTINSRISALAQAQDIMAQSNLSSAAVQHVVAAALRPHVDARHRVHFSGPDVEISSQQALGLSLAIHELATNAAKYGALSNAQGRVAIRWTIGPESRFSFGWQESDGPIVEKPARRGFGTTLTNRVVAAYFAGNGETFYEPEGLRYVLDGVIEAVSEV